jgi:hypothetical protein
MKRRVLGYFLSAASVYLALGYMTQLFMSIFHSFAFAI